METGPQKSPDLSALAAPFEAHVLSVIYYRITDPEKPVIDRSIRTWQSVWEVA